jgi:putative ABC transport system permease protein
MPQFLVDLISSPINLIALAIVVPVVGVAIGYAIARPKLARLMLKNLGRNAVRTSLIALAIAVLVAKVTLVWTVIYFFDAAQRERSKDIKLIISERWQLPSRLPVKHADYLDPNSPSMLSELTGKYGPNDFMTWSFYGGSVDPANRTVKDIVFLFVLNPDRIKTMMDDLSTYDDALVEKLKATRNGCLLGRDRLANLNKRVGDTFKSFSFSHKGIDLEFEIVGELPEGRYNQSGIMRTDYFLGAFEEYSRKNGRPHELQEPDRRLNYIWLRVPDRAAFDEVGAFIEKAPVFSQRPIKVETGSSGIGLFLEAYADLLWGMKYLLAPAMLAIMALVVAIAISISIRERRTEIAVMKVLGFQPGQVMSLVMGESLILGAVSGFVAAALTFALINWAVGGIPFPIGFFPAFLIPKTALAWGTAMGSICALAGSYFPAQQARAVRVSEVFSKVT